MTKRDYERAAKLIRENEVIADGDSGGINIRHFVVDLFIEFFQDDNPRFDRTRFRKACEDA